jgi:hypothetical protein
MVGDGHFAMQNALQGFSKAMLLEQRSLRSVVSRGFPSPASAMAGISCYAKDL